MDQRGENGRSSKNRSEFNRKELTEAVEEWLRDNEDGHHHQIWLELCRDGFSISPQGLYLLLEDMVNDGKIEKIPNPRGRSGTFCYRLAKPT
jgi:hypothetical protein